MIPTQKVKEIISKHSLLEKELSSGKISKEDFAFKSKEYSDLNEIISTAKEFENYEKNKNELENLINDEKNETEIKTIANEELKQLQLKYDINVKKLKLFLLPKDEADTKNAMIEIRAGTGGLEASLFASDLFKMYEKISNKKNG